MPLEEDDQVRVDRAMDDVGADSSGTRLLVLNASHAQKLGYWTIVCTVINRSVGSGLQCAIGESPVADVGTTGSGIFVTPAILLKATGSPGASLVLWFLGGMSSLCALLIWLEFSFSIPKFWVPKRNDDDSKAEGEVLECVPRSGGEKNFVSTRIIVPP